MISGCAGRRRVSSARRSGDRGGRATSRPTLRSALLPVGVVALTGGRRAEAAPGRCCWDCAAPPLPLELVQRTSASAAGQLQVWPTPTCDPPPRPAPLMLPAARLPPNQSPAHSGLARYRFRFPSLAAWSWRPLSAGVYIQAYRAYFERRTSAARREVAPGWIPSPAGSPFPVLGPGWIGRSSAEGRRWGRTSVRSGPNPASRRKPWAASRRWARRPPLDGVLGAWRQDQARPRDRGPALARQCGSAVTGGGGAIGAWATAGSLRGPGRLSWPCSIAECCGAGRWRQLRPAPPRPGLRHSTDPDQVNAALRLQSAARFGGLDVCWSPMPGRRLDRHHRRAGPRELRASFRAQFPLPIKPLPSGGGLFRDPGLRRQRRST